MSDRRDPAAPPFALLDNPRLEGVLTPVEAAVFRYSRSVLVAEEAFRHAICRALDNAVAGELEALAQHFPEIFAAWQALHRGELAARLRPLATEGA